MSYPSTGAGEQQYSLSLMKSSSKEFDPDSQEPAHRENSPSEEQIKIDEDLAAQRLQKQQTNHSHLKYLAE